MSLLVVAKSEESTRTRFDAQPPYVAPTNQLVAVYTGALQAWVVPGGVTLIHVEAWAAQGGDSLDTSGQPGSGGYGAFIEASYTVTPGETLNLRVGGKGARVAYGAAVGGGGFNGGGNVSYNEYGYIGNTPGGAGGGGATDVRQGGDALANRIMIAAGGGGAGIAWSGNAQDNQGGAGGTSTGEAGYLSQTGVSSSTKSNVLGYGGEGGTASAGGIAGVGSGSTVAPTAGALGVGGNGGYSTSSTVQNAGGGGGGYYGGGGGIFNNSTYAGSAGGGGGSSYLGAGYGTVVITQGIRSGNGIMRITW